MKEGRFQIDGQLHIPPERLEETISTAIERGLDALVFTDYGSTSNFDFLEGNKDKKGDNVLNPKAWDVEKKSDIVLKLLSEKGNIYIIKGEELKTKQGHLLAWGIEEPIECNIDIEETIKRIYKQRGIAVFPHLLTQSFHGCGEEVFKSVYKRIRELSPYPLLPPPLGLEQNGQIPSRWMKDNKDVEKIAREHNIPCFGTSDIHGNYRQEHRKIGLRNYSSINKIFIDTDNIVESLKTTMVLYPTEIKVEGAENTLLETVLWNVDSIRKNGFGKIKDLVDGIKAA